MRNQTRRILFGTLFAVWALGSALFWIMTDRIGADATDQQIDEILDSTEQVTFSAITESVQDIERVTIAMAELAERPDEAQPEYAMAQAITFFPELSGVFIANGDGYFHFVFRSEDGFTTKRIIPSEQGFERRQVLFTNMNSDFVETRSWSDPTDTFDPRTRPWFEAATAERGNAIWTKPYVFFTAQQPGITRAVASDNEWDWIVGIDVELGNLVVILEQLSTLHSGEVFLFDGENGALTKDGLIDLRDEPTSNDLRVRAAMAARDNAETDGDTQVRYVFDDSDHTVRFAPVPLGDQSWKLVIDLTDDDVAVPVSKLVGAVRLLGLAITFAAVFALAMLMLPATHPLSRLEREASEDSLTALPNRRAILQRGEIAASSGANFGVAMIDVDKFKQVNDVHGHLVGDEVLRGLAKILMDGDLEAGRLGGEEFVVFLPGDRDEMSAAAERMRRLVETKSVDTSIGPVDLTISVGIASRRNSEVFTDVLKRADGALLEAKLNGRNIVVSGDHLELHADEALH